MPGLNLFKRDTSKPRVTIRERFRNVAARVMPRSRKARAGGGADTTRRAMVVGSLASVAILPSSVLAADAGGDAELLNLARKHDAAFARACALDEPESPLFDSETLDEICEAYTDLEFAIQDIPAQTWAGVVEKARIAAEYAYDQAGMRTLDNIVPSLIDDILRLAGTSAKRPAPPAKH